VARLGALGDRRWAGRAPRRTFRSADIARGWLVEDSDEIRLGKDVGKRLRRFERRLARVRDNEAKWEDQQSTDQAGTVESERDVSVGQQAFCMRERRKVVIAGATAIVLKNGRAAVAGTCPTCGARVVTTARSVVAPVAHG
jgi:hypothetical protein